MSETISFSPGRVLTLGLSLGERELFSGRGGTLSPALIFPAALFVWFVLETLSAASAIFWL